MWVGGGPAWCHVIVCYRARWCAFISHPIYHPRTFPQPPTPTPTPGKFRNAGQTCVSPNRLLVQAGIHDRFVARLTEKVRTWAFWRTDWVWVWVWSGVGWGVGSGLVCWVWVWVWVLLSCLSALVCACALLVRTAGPSGLAGRQRTKKLFRTTHRPTDRRRVPPTHAPTHPSLQHPPPKKTQPTGVGAAGGPRAPAGGAARPLDQRGGPAEGAAPRGGRRQEGA